MSNNDDNCKTGAAPRYQPCDVVGRISDNFSPRMYVNDMQMQQTVIYCGLIGREAETLARRVAVCLNYCANLSTEQLEGIVLRRTEAYLNFCADIPTEQMEAAVELHRHRPDLSDSDSKAATASQSDPSTDSEGSQRAATDAPSASEREVGENPSEIEVFEAALSAVSRMRSERVEKPSEGQVEADNSEPSVKSDTVLLPRSLTETEAALAARIDGLGASLQRIERRLEQLADRMTHDDLILSERINGLSERVLSAERTVTALTDNMLAWQRRVQAQGDSLSNLESRFRSLDSVVLEELSTVANLSASMSEVLGRLDRCEYEMVRSTHGLVPETATGISILVEQITAQVMSRVRGRLDRLEDAPRHANDCPCICGPLEVEEARNNEV